VFGRGWQRAEQALRAEATLVAVLVASFIARWLLADRRSYWYDEFLSVHVYGQWHPSVGAAIQHLGDASIHPPLYQFILYEWMELFGGSERATRSLSNLYITLAALFLYLLMRDAFSRRVALASAVAFTLMYTPMYYAMESRSYAQTIFLATLSSYALLHLARLVPDRGWRRTLLSPTAVLFTLANVGLLLTHYYNAFFCLAQAILAGLFVLRERLRRSWLAGLGVVAGAYALQAAVFALVWGRQFLAGYQRRSDDFALEGGVRSPFELLLTIVRPNVDGPQVVYWLLLVVGVATTVHAVVVLARPSPPGPARHRAWTTVYLAGWLVAPLLVTVAVFEIAGVARYNERYWLFIVPALAPLLVLLVKEAASLVRVGLRRFAPSQESAIMSVLVGVLGVVTVGTLVAPGTLAAATETKEDYRGTARAIVNMIQQDSQNEYLIYEVTPRAQPFSTYYLEQFSGSIGVDGVVRRGEEQSGTFRLLTGDQPVVAEHDYLVIVFAHDRARDYPNLLQQLDERYELHSRYLDRAGRGFIVYKIQPGEPPAP
jgi:uncharacterized membrane protein